MKSVSYQRSKSDTCRQILRKARILSYSEREILNGSDIDNWICENSKMKYQSGVNKLLEYCDSRNLEPIPTKMSLCHFISKVSREMQPSSLNTYLTGIVHHFAHSHPEVRDMRLSRRVRETVKGCSKSSATATRRAKAMTRELRHSSANHSTIYSSTPF